MKKIMLLMLIAVMSLSVIACGGNTADKKDADIQQTNGENDNQTDNAEASNDTQANELHEQRAKELADILCGGKWMSRDGVLYFNEDGTMRYEYEYSGEQKIKEGSWEYWMYVINGEVEGAPDSEIPVMQIQVGYSDEQGCYYFSCTGDYSDTLVVGCSENDEMVLHYCGEPYWKVDEIEITADNWQEYFEFKFDIPSISVRRNAFDEIETIYADNAGTYFALKEEFADKYFKAEVAVEVYTNQADAVMVKYNIDSEQFEMEYFNDYERLCELFRDDASDKNIIREIKREDAILVYGEYDLESIEGNIAYINVLACPNSEVVRVQGTLVLKK